MLKIFTLVRTQLNYNSQIWHFPTFAMAQGKMLDLCTNIVGEHCTLNTTMVTTNGWHFAAGMDYATCSNGDKVEFEIFEEEINMREFMLHEIANYVCGMDLECNNYYDIILDSLDYFSIDCLPRMTDAEIKHFIDTELESAMACRAADTINEGHDDDELHEIVFDYLMDNRGFSFMAKIINNDQDAIKELKINVADECKERGINLFPYSKEDMIKSVVDRIVERYAYTKQYSDVFYNNIKSLDESLINGCLPTSMSQHDIDEYIDSALLDFMARVAADVLMDDESLTSVEDADKIVVNYLSESSFETLARIINNDSNQIDGIKKDIDNMCSADGFVIFHKEYVWVYKSYWNNGRNFEKAEYIEIFKNHDAAYMAMKSTMEDVINTFRTCYNENEVLTYEKDNLFQVIDKNLHDVWEGTLTKQYIQD